MGCLPDELWAKILGMGVENRVLDYRDLCSLAFVCRRIRRISSLDCMWRPLWERDQAELGGGKDNETKSFRELYRIRLVFFSLHAFLVERFFVRTVEVLCVRLGCITCRENFILLFLFRLFHLMRAQDNLRELSEYRGR
jgi:hypothetical protein